MKSLLDYFKKNDIGEPPWDYDFLINLDESEYPKYLAKIFNYRTGEKLPLKFDFKTKSWIIDKNRCKTFNQKIQWIKLYGVTPLMRRCTDKVAVRDYVQDQIGREYLKPVLQICNSFDEVDFESLPKAFVIKCNHGSKWQYIIKDKEQFLNTPKLIEIIKKQMTGWLEQEYFPWNGFEMQYKGITPKILIEKLMRDKINIPCEQIQIYFINNRIKYIIKIHNNNKITIWDENLDIAEDIFIAKEEKVDVSIDSIIKQSIDLSIILIKNIVNIIIRVDWIIFNNKLYFGEITFTPYSGFRRIKIKEI